MDKKKREILISGYGPGKENQASVALYELTNQLEVAETLWEDTITAPSFLCTYQDMCFAIREGEQNGAVLCYQRKGNEYIVRDQLELEGGYLCHIVYQPLNQTLYCSFYETGHVAAIKVEDYHFAKLLNFFQIPPLEAGGLTRAHCCAIEPEGNRILTTNIAQDRIYLYESVDGFLKSDANCEYIQIEKGIGPRHIMFHPINELLYIITEYSNEIISFQYEVEDGLVKTSMIQQVSTLPDNFEGTSYGSSIDISKDGRFLYAANRGADTIAVFRLNQDGTLQKIQDKPCGGKFPRHISLTKDDTGLMIANQESDSVVIYQVDEKMRTLLEVASRIPFLKPSYIEEI